jgi:chromosome partitioning protein
MYAAGTRLATEVSQDVDEFFRNGRERPTPWAGAKLFQSRIRRNIRLAEAPGFGQSIFQYAADSHGAEDYRLLAAEVATATGAGDEN